MQYRASSQIGVLERDGKMVSGVAIANRLTQLCDLGKPIILHSWDFVTRDLDASGSWHGPRVQHRLGVDRAMQAASVQR